MNHYHIKQRVIYAVLALATIALGLASRTASFNAPEFITLYVGDALWAALVFWLVCLVFPAKKISICAMLALSFAFSIELSQLYQANWINEIRHTRLGGLILGFGFRWSDLLAYAAGIGLACILRHLFEIKAHKNLSA